MKIPLLELRDVDKYFGSVIALRQISVVIREGEITCILGDNGAGKSTLIKILSGVFRPSSGSYLYDGEEVQMKSPREARSQGISTVYQDLSIVPLMSIWRNFFLGMEPVKGVGPFRYFDKKYAKEVVVEEMQKMGIDVRDPDQPVGSMSGGERQALAIARAIFFGARVLILDEPTAALGVKQGGIVLRNVLAAKKRGLGVILITHNPNHAYPVGDQFLILNRGRSMGMYQKQKISHEYLIHMMAGGEDFDTLVHDLEDLRSGMDIESNL